VSTARIAVADLGSGNLRSVAKALTAVGAEVIVSADPDVVARADKLVVPGQGAFGACAAGLDRDGGALRQAVHAFIEAGRPFFGICIGMQLLFGSSEENPEAPGLGILPGRVRRFADHPGLKIPHMGWNELTDLKPHPLLAGIAARAHAYFVHSFQLKAARPETVLALTDYGGPITAAVGRDNLAGTQFHPEKSQATGLRLIANFLRWKP